MRPTQRTTTWALWDETQAGKDPTLQKMVTLTINFPRLQHEYGDRFATDVLGLYYHQEYEVYQKLSTDDAFKKLYADTNQLKTKQYIASRQKNYWDRFGPTKDEAAAEAARLKDEEPKKAFQLKKRTHAELKMAAETIHYQNQLNTARLLADP